MTEYPRSPCPIASTLDTLGDKWTLVVVRDLLVGKSRYGEFLDSPEGLSTNILADRLKTLENSGLVSKAPYGNSETRNAYTLTEKGEALLPVLQEMCRWGNRFLPGTWVPPTFFMERRIDNEPA